MQFLNQLLSLWGNGQTPWAVQQMEAMKAGGMPQMPVAQSAPPMPSGMLGGAGRMAAAPTPPAMPRQAPQMAQGGPDVAPPSFGTYATGALRGASQANNPVGAILGAIGGAMGAGGEVEQSNQTYKLLVSRGVDPAEAALAIRMGPQAQMALLRDVMARNRPMSEADQLDLEKKRLEVDAMRNKPAQTVEINGRLVRVGPDGTAEEIYAAPDSGSDAAAKLSYGVNPSFTHDGKAYVIGNDGSIKFLDLGESRPLQPGELAEQKAMGKTRGQTMQEARDSLPGVLSDASTIAAQIDETLANPAFSRSVGPMDQYLPNVSADANKFQSQIKQLQGATFLQAFQKLKGGGQITEIEGTKAEQAIARLQATGVSEADYRKALTDLRDIARNGVIRAQVMAGQRPESDLSLMTNFETIADLVQPQAQDAAKPQPRQFSPRGAPNAPQGEVDLGDGFKMKVK